MRGTIVLLAALAACSSKSRPGDWKVVEVTDDGLIRAERGGDLTALRLHGVELPPDRGPDAPAASGALRQLVDGKRATWVAVREAPRTGYTIVGPDWVTLTVDGIDVNSEMLARGWGRAADDAPPALVELERRARDGKLGGFSAAHRVEVVAWMRRKALNISLAPVGDMTPAAFRLAQWQGVQLQRKEDLAFFGHVLTDADVGPPPCADRVAGALIGAGGKAVADDVVGSAFAAGATLVGIPATAPQCEPWQVKAGQLVRQRTDGGDSITETRGFELATGPPGINWTSRTSESRNPSSGTGGASGGSGPGRMPVVAATDTALVVGHEPWFRSVDACKSAIAAIADCR